MLFASKKPTNSAKNKKLRKITCKKPSIQTVFSMPSKPHSAFDVDNFV